MQLKCFKILVDIYSYHLNTAKVSTGRTLSQRLGRSYLGQSLLSIEVRKELTLRLQKLYHYHDTVILTYTLGTAITPAFYTDQEPRRPCQEVEPSAGQSPSIPITPVMMLVTCGFIMFAICCSLLMGCLYSLCGL